MQLPNFSFSIEGYSNLSPWGKIVTVTDPIGARPSALLEAAEGRKLQCTGVLSRLYFTVLEIQRQ